MYCYIENKLEYKTYCKLRESVGWKNFSIMQAQEAIEKSAYTIIAQENGETVAMARLIGDGLYYTIADVVVNPGHQGQGIGTEMIKRILCYIEERLPEDGRVSIALISEKGKEAFYERFGFKRMPHEFCGAGMRKVLYGKK